jgi:hypothetical protein
MERFSGQLGSNAVEITLVDGRMEMYVCNVGTFDNLKDKLKDAKYAPEFKDLIKRAAQHFEVIL